jgi:hypothetical protein
MKFVLAGFGQTGNVRRYSFEGIADDKRTRVQFSVAVDLTLLHKHRIPLQDVPLLCCLFLSSRAQSGNLRELDSSEREFTFPEQEILLHADQLAKERGATEVDRKPKPFAFTKTPIGASPLIIDPQNTRSGIGLGSRSGLRVTS